MSDDSDKIAAQEQLERRRLARLVEALPAFSGFVTPDGHIISSRPSTDEAFLWSLPSFAYAHDSITQIVDLCERASAGERIQIERPYLKSTEDGVEIFGRGLLTLTPILDDGDHVEELAISLLDTDETGLAPRDPFAKSRLLQANARIESMLSLAQTVIEVSQSDDGTVIDRDLLSSRLDALASVIDVVSDPDLTQMPIDELLKNTLNTLPDDIKTKRLQRITSGGDVPMASIPLMVLLLSELVANARQHGAWKTDLPKSKSRQSKLEKSGAKSQTGKVSIQSEIMDSAHGRVLRLHWIEDGGPKVPAALGRGFGFTLGERLFPQVTGGKSHLLNSEDGLSWTFELPIPDTDEGFGFDGISE